MSCLKRYRIYINGKYMETHDFDILDKLLLIRFIRDGRIDWGEGRYYGYGPGLVVHIGVKENPDDYKVQLIEDMGEPHY